MWIRFVVIASVCILLILLLARFRPNLEITFMDVGQGDSIFIHSPSGNTYLIDGGSTSYSKIGEKILLPFLKSQGIRSIDYLVATHMDADHINGLMEILTLLPDRSELDMAMYFTVKNLILPDVMETSQEYDWFLHTAENKGIKVILMKAGLSIQDGDLSLLCLHPTVDFTKESSNESSLVLLLQYGEFEALLTGDLEGGGEESLCQELLKEGEKEKINELEVLKVAHHGSRNSTKEELLSIVLPQYAIISCSANNIYGHPHKETVDRILAVDADIITTYEYGAITVITNGQSMKIKTYLR